MYRPFLALVRITIFFILVQRQMVSGLAAGAVRTGRGSDLGLGVGDD